MGDPRVKLSELFKDGRGGEFSAEIGQRSIEKERLVAHSFHPKKVLDHLSIRILTISI